MYYSVEVKRDVMDVVRRIKYIDKGYSIRYNRLQHRYELHHTRAYPNTFVLMLPFKQLDARAVDYVNRTRISRLDNIVKEIEVNNSRLEQGNYNRILDEAGYKAKHLVEYIDRGGNNLPSYNDI